MKVILNKKKNYLHQKYQPGETADIPDNIARRWIDRGIAYYFNSGIYYEANKINNLKVHDRVSIVVLVKDALDYVKKCIKSIALYTDDYELIIVDNGSKAETKKFLENIGYVDYTLITNKKNMGVSYGWNQGIKIAKSEYICFINSDCQVTHDWLPRMFEGFGYTENVGIVGPSTSRTVPMQTIPESMGKYRVEDDNTINHYADIAPEHYTITRLTAFCWIVKRKVFDEIGVFDWKRYGLAWHEDVDFTWRVDKAGFKMVWCTASYVHHFGGKTTSEMKLDTALRDENEKKLDKRKKLSNIYIANDVELGKIEIKTSKVSIIILVKDALPYFKKCLESLVKYTTSYELIIVDNGSKGSTKKYILEQQAALGYTLITNDENKGFAYGCNQGVKVATCNYICFLNSDTVLTKDWLRRLKAGFSLPDAGLIGPSTSCANSRQMVDGFYKRRFDMTGREIYNVPNVLPKGYEESYLTGFCLLTSRAVIDKIGVFDYHIAPIAYYEDVDFYNRTKKVGYKAYWIRHSYVHHYGHRTATDLKLDSRRIATEALKRFNKKKDTDIYVVNDVEIVDVKKNKQTAG